eukprot:SAG11_NODE_6581_length_1284_cov_1.532489_1_plen_176_part_10
MASTLNEWLASCKLDRYAAALEEDGYDALEFLVAADEADILEASVKVKMKKPHAKAFLAAWKVLVGAGGGQGGCRQSDGTLLANQEVPPLVNKSVEANSPANGPALQRPSSWREVRVVFRSRSPPASPPGSPPRPPIWHRPAAAAVAAAMVGIRVARWAPPLLDVAQPSWRWRRRL